MDAIAFQNNCSFITPAHSVGLQNLVGKWQRAVNTGNTIVQHHIGVLAQRAQNLAARQRGPHRVAVGARMRGQHKTLALLDLSQNVLQHNVILPYSPSASAALQLEPCSSSRAGLPAPTILPLEPFPAPPGPAGNTTREPVSIAVSQPTRDGYIRGLLPDPRCSYLRPHRPPPH